MSEFKMYSKEAEESVLGCLLLDGRLAVQYVHKMCEGDFLTPDAREIFKAIKKCADDGKEIDLVTVSAEFSDEKRGELSASGARMAQTVPTVTMIENYFGILKEMSEKRRICKVLESGIMLANEGRESSEILSEMLKNLPRDTYLNGNGSFSEAVIEFYDDLTKRYQKDVLFEGIKTGFPRLDALLGGMQRGELIVLGARPSVGKSAFAGSVFLNAVINKIPAMFFSYEMPRVQIVRRLVAGEARVKNMNMRLGILNDKDFERIALATDKLSKGKCEIYDDCPDFGELKARASSFRARGGDLGVIIVDYLQLMPGRGKNLRDVVEFNSRMLKRLAKELNCAILCLSQLSRAVEGRDTGEPYLSDLRESGAIEQDADVVLFLYRDEEKRSIKVAKARDGDLGRVQLSFYKDYVSFCEPMEEKKMKIKEEKTETEEVEFPEI